MVKKSAYTATKPDEFKEKGDSWAAEGWRVDVDFEMIDPIDFKEDWEQVKKLLPEKYSPLNKSGSGNQMYLTRIPIAFGDYLESRALKLKESNPSEIPSSKDVWDHILADDRLSQVYKSLSELLDDSVGRWRPSRQRQLKTSVLWYGVDLPNVKSSLAFGLKATGKLIFHFGMMANDDRPPFTEESMRRQYAEKLQQVPGIILADGDWNSREKEFPLGLIQTEASYQKLASAVNWYVLQVVEHINGSEIEHEKSILDCIVPAPDRKPEKSKRPSYKGRKIDWEQVERINRLTGNNGEKWVLEFERKRLESEGRVDLSREVMWISKDQGDGLGYDILSFDFDGQERHIEVKTSWGPDRPFYVSSNELSYSKDNSSRFYLYRVYGLSSDPEVYILKGDLTDHFNLTPTQYRASR